MKSRRSSIPLLCRFLYKQNKKQDNTVLLFKHTLQYWRGCSEKHMPGGKTPGCEILHVVEIKQSLVPSQQQWSWQQEDAVDEGNNDDADDDDGDDWNGYWNGSKVYD